MDKKKGFLRLTLVLSIIVGVLSGVIGYISAEQPNPFADLIPQQSKEQPNIFDDILPDVKPKKDYFAEEISQEQPVSGFIPDIVIPEWSKVTAGILWLIIGFISVWTIYGFIRWCVINLTIWIIAGFKTSQ